MDKKQKTGSGEDRRRARRTVVRESFQLYFVIPKLLGMVRIYIRDISQVGISFRSEVEADLSMGQLLQGRLYLNPAFYLPVDCKVVRVGRGEVAVEFNDPSAPATQAISHLQDFFAAAEQAGVFVE